MDIEIDMPEWFDNTIGWFFSWGMSPGFFDLPNIWMVAAGLIIFLLIISIVRIGRVRRREGELAREREAHSVFNLHPPGDEW